MAIKRVRYNGRVIASAGCGLNYVSPHPTRDLLGVDRAVNQPVFGIEQAFAAPPEAPVSVSAFTVLSAGLNSIVAAGVDGDGTTPVAVRVADDNAGNVAVTVEVGQSLAANGWGTNIAGILARPLAKQIRSQAGDALGGASKAAAGRQDILRLSGAGNGEEAAWAYQPVSGVVAHGAIMVVCIAWHERAMPAVSSITRTGSVATVTTATAHNFNTGDVATISGATETQYNGSFLVTVTSATTFDYTVTGTPATPATGTPALAAWNRAATAVVWFDRSDSTWKLVNRSAITAFGALRGSEFTNTNWFTLDRNQANPLEVWYPVTNYLSNSQANNNNTVQLVRATRSAVGQPWAVQGAEVLAVPTDAGAVNQHIHGVGVGRWGAAGVFVYVTPGHDTEANKNSCWLLTRDSVDGWNALGPSTNGGTANGWTLTRNVLGDSIAFTRRLSYPNNMNVGMYGRNPRQFFTMTDEKSPISNLDTVPSVLSNKGTSETTPNNCAAWGGFLAGYNPWGPRAANDLTGPFVVYRSTGAQATAIPIAPGTAWNGFGPANKLIASADGLNWAQVFTRASRTMIYPAMYGGSVLLPNLPGTTRELLTFPLPPLASGRPLLVSPGCTNYCLATPTWDAPGGTNTVTNVTATYQNAGFVTGRTIPPCPSLGAVWRATLNGSNSYAGRATLTPSLALTAGRRTRVKAWIYLLPPAEPFVDNNTRPYNNSTTSTIQLSFADQANTGGGFTVNRIAQGLNGTGWIPVQFELDTTGWTATFSLLAQIQTITFSPAERADFLIAFESVIQDAAGANPPPMPIVPPPMATAAGVGVLNTLAESVGFNCSNTWTLALTLQMPENGHDQYTLNLPTGRTLAWLVESDTPARRISIAYDVANRRISFTDGTTTRTVAAVANEEFELGRGSQIHIGISGTVSGSDTTIALAVSVGGSQVNTDSFTWTGLVLRPSKVVHADANRSAVDGHAVHAVYCDEDTALTTTQLGTLLRSGEAANPPASNARRTLILE